MSRNIKISSIGMPQFHTDGEKNAAKVFAKCKTILTDNLQSVVCDKPDLIVLPETCNCPYEFSLANNKAYFEDYSPQLFALIADFAKTHHVNILLPTYVLTGGRIFNSIQLFDRSGLITGRYDKAFPLIEETTEQGISPGVAEPELLRTDIGTIAGVICFDLNFDKLRAHYKALHPDIIVFSSMFHGGSLQWQWAYDINAHFVGTIAGPQNRILLPTGDVFAAASNYYPNITATINLDGAQMHLDHNMPKLAQAKQKYGEKLKISDPGFLGSVYVTAETDEFTIQQIIDEYELELLTDYITRSEKFADEHRIGR